MSQSMRICCSGLSPILQHKSSPSSSCMFGRRMEHRCMEVGGGGFPIINLSLVMKEECSSSRKRASVVSNHNPRIPFLPCATLRNSIVDEGTISGRSNYANADNYNPFKIMFLGALFKWWMFLYNLIPGEFDNPPQVNAEVVSLLVYFDLHDPIDGLKVLLDVSRAWRMVLYLSSDELYDGFYLDDYGESYFLKARMEVPADKGQDYHIKKSFSRMTTRLSIFRLLANLNDPNEGLQVMLGALDIWETRFMLNDSEGYLQKERFAILDLSQRLRILVSNDKHDEANSRITIVVEILKPMIDHFEHSKDHLKTMSEEVLSRPSDDIYCVVASIVAIVNFGDLCCLLY